MKSYSSLFLYWFFSFVFAVGFGEIFLSGIINKNPVIFQHFFAISVYYILLCLIFSFIVIKLNWKICLGIFFVVGVLLETFVFKNMKSIIDFLFFGLLYVFLFGVPLWAVKRVKK